MQAEEEKLSFYGRFSQIISATAKAFCHKLSQRGSVNSLIEQDSDKGSEEGDDNDIEN